MPVTMTALTSGADTTDRAFGDDYITASITPTANRLVLAAIISDALDSAPTLSGNGLTWVQVATVAMTGAAECKLTLFRAMGASPSAGVVNIAQAADHQAGCIWSIKEFAGVDTGGTNGSAAVLQPTTGPETSITGPAAYTVTLPNAFDVGESATYGAFAVNSNIGGAVDILPGANFIEIHSTGHGAPTRGLHVQWFNGKDATVDASENDAVMDWIGIALEIKAAVAVAARYRALLGVGE